MVGVDVESESYSIRLRSRPGNYGPGINKFFKLSGRHTKGA